jgi:hypothetical protein
VTTFVPVDDAIIDESDRDLGYVTPGTLLAYQPGSPLPATIDLSDPSLRLGLGRLLHLCGVSGSHIGVVVTPPGHMIESDRSNNVQAVPFTAKGCDGKFVCFY